ncbi:MAG TPA: endonuclease III [Candidatus Latescibacteria bacterium]|jgi:endonuclease-3|nr:endonuclease III [Gemmatimonadaceae bacterium]MDP6016734.1 endonuclease III [Candidatus Latescibacterota bacterium]HJP32926.1 endonuclease III [Candidatus Latescibacterota bacterium]
MTRTEKAAFILETLDRLYPLPPIPLSHRSPYELLIAVLLSTQTTDVKVNQVTPALFKAANTPGKMTRLSVDDILAMVRTVGLAPGKSKNIHRLSELLLKRHDGEVPQTLAELEALPGVGHKTASVVVAQAFGQPAFPVDTHIHRLAWRWALSTGKNVEQTEKDLKRTFPQEAWNKLHLQIIYFGREHCPALRHDMSACPICAAAGRKSLLK